MAHDLGFIRSKGRVQHRLLDTKDAEREGIGRTHLYIRIPPRELRVQNDESDRPVGDQTENDEQHQTRHEASFSDSVG